MILSAELERYNDTDFCLMVKGEFGWSVGAQAEGIFAGQPLEDQNPNALKMIADFAKSRKEHVLAEEIYEHLKNRKKDI